MQLDKSSINRILFFAHFILTVLAMSSGVLPSGYFISQSVIIAFFSWSFIQKESSESFYLLSISSFITFFTDIIILTLAWTSGHGFQQTMALINIFLKPIIAYMALNTARERDGVSSTEIPTFGNWGSPQMNAQQQQQQQQTYQSNQQYSGYQQS